jgi:hypothetical protein
MASQVVWEWIVLGATMNHPIDCSYTPRGCGYGHTRANGIVDTGMPLSKGDGVDGGGRYGIQGDGIGSGIGSGAPKRTDGGGSGHGDSESTKSGDGRGRVNIGWRFPGVELALLLRRIV